MGGTPEDPASLGTPDVVLDQSDFKFAADRLYRSGKNVYRSVLCLYPFLALAPLVSVGGRRASVIATFLVALVSLAIAIMRQATFDRMAKGARCQACEDRVRFHAELSGLQLVWESPVLTDREIRGLAVKEKKKLKGEDHQFKDPGRVSDFYGQKKRATEFVIHSQRAMGQGLLVILVAFLAVVIGVWIQSDNTLTGFLIRGLPLVIPGILFILDDYLTRRLAVSEFTEFLRELDQEANRVGSHACEHGIQVMHDQLRRRFSPVPDKVFAVAKRRLVQS